MCVYFNILNEADCFGAIGGGVYTPSPLLLALLSLSFSLSTPTPPDDDSNDNFANQAAIFICNIHIYVDIFRSSNIICFRQFSAY